MILKYLDFDYSEDTQEVGTFDAMASVSAAQVGAVYAEVEQVLAWAARQFGHECGPVDEGFAWHHDLQAQQEFTVNEHPVFDPLTGRVRTQTEQAGAPRYTVTLSISGSSAFCEALRAQFDLG
ncbi:MAG: hypothetical protein HY836_01715 [Aquabacterium sp.]|uniref:hypothetical protein n=1 Tax=Aquabacterium sp. TaxID=1872578 RepID=UPI0025BD37B8|nr:hypothetical protein [Aquabacterium sp.]MBI5924291.1 hypothetical protein [Aquabacterium sp.]